MTGIPIIPEKMVYLPLLEAQARERQLSSLKQNTSIVKVKFPERWKGQSRDHVAKDLEARDASRARLDAPEDPTFPVFPISAYCSFSSASISSIEKDK